jgi:NADPH:quinone reductase-like Zn-dependent oxidoreductase
MKAVRIHDYGDVDVLRYEEAPQPQLRAGDILVRVEAAGVNPLDHKVRQGYLKARIALPMPTILGWDIAGVVEAAAPDVTRFKVGDAVYAKSEMGRDGGYAEYLTLQAKDAALAPVSIPLAEAAAYPLACLTAWGALFEKAQLQAGQSVLIHAAAGGVGNFAVQMAKNAGARVTATASGDAVELVRSLGADRVIDYRKEDVTTAVGNMDVVFDTVGGDVLAASYALVRPGGALVTIAGLPDPTIAEACGIRALFVAVQCDGPRLEALALDIDGGRLKALAVTQVPLADAAAAHTMSASGRTRGKIILRP